MEDRQLVEVSMCNNLRAIGVRIVDTLFFSDPRKTLKKEFPIRKSLLDVGRVQ